MLSTMSLIPHKKKRTGIRDIVPITEFCDNVYVYVCIMHHVCMYLSLSMLWYIHDTYTPARWRHVRLSTLRDQHENIVLYENRIEVSSMYIQRNHVSWRNPCVGTTLLRDRILVETRDARGRACPDSASSWSLRASAPSEDEPTEESCCWLVP